MLAQNSLVSGFGCHLNILAVLEHKCQSLQSVCKETDFFMFFCGIAFFHHIKNFHIIKCFHCIYFFHRITVFHHYFSHLRIPFRVTSTSSRTLLLLHIHLYYAQGAVNTTKSFPLASPTHIFPLQHSVSLGVFLLADISPVFPPPPYYTPTPISPAVFMPR